MPSPRQTRGSHSATTAGRNEGIYSDIVLGNYLMYKYLYILNKMAIDLIGKSSNDILALLYNKYPNPPKYINPTKFKYNTGSPNEAIDTAAWSFVTPQFVNDKYTGIWISSSDGGGILNNDEFIKELLSNTKELEEATIPKNGGRRRAQRKTKVKSKKRANKRRTRSRK